MKEYGSARRFALGGLAFTCITLICALLASSTQSAQNPIQAENARTGTTAWQLNNPASNRQIEGYASAVSINRGGAITFYVNTTDSTFTLQVFRLGWYQGTGGRAITQPVTLPGIRQTIPSPDPTYGMTECNWSPSYTLQTSNSDPTQWVSGFYVVVLTGSSGNQWYIPFVVRDDSRISNLLWSVSFNTYEAYNAWGGKSLYTYNSSSSIPGAQSQPGGVGQNNAVKVSFSRPFDDGWGTGQFLSYDFDMIGFLEQRGYDVTYQTDLDTHLNAASLLQHNAVITVGHDEYWTLQMRQNVTAARDAGVNLGFFGANTIYWQVRYEPSPISGVANRTIVGYKEDAAVDPDAQNPSTYPLITKLYRQAHGNLPAQPEDALVGVMYDYQPVSGDIIVVNPSHWVFANTGLTNGSHIKGVLGYEVDREFGDQPTNTVLLAHSPYKTSSGQTQNADMTIYQAPSGAWVFGAGTIQWDWALSNISPWGPTSSLVNPAAQQITDNILNQFIASGPVSTPTPTASSTPTSSPTATVFGTPTATTTASATTSGTPTPTATPSPGSPPIFRSAVWTGPAVGTTCPANTPAGTQVGDVEIAMISTLNYTTGLNATVSPPAGWTLVPGASCSDSGKDQQQAVFYHVVGASEPASYTWPITGNPYPNACNAIIADYSNANAASPIDASGCLYASSGSTVIAPSIATLTPNDRLLWIGTGFEDAIDSTLWSTPAGFAQRAVGQENGNLGSNFADEVFGLVGATGAVSASMSLSDSHVGSLVALAPKPGTGSPTPSPTPTSTATESPTSTPTRTSTSTATATSTLLATPTPTSTGTQGTTPTPTPTATATPGTGITLRGTGTGSTSAVSSQVVITTPAGVQPTDLMIAEIAVRGGTATTITPPAGWTLVRRDNQTTSLAQAIYQRLVPSSPPEPSSYTWTFTSGNDAAGAIAAYTGVSSATPIDVSNGQGNASSNNLTAPSVTVPSGDNSDRLVALFSIASGAVTVTVPSGMNQLWSFHATGYGISVAAADLNMTNSGATGTKVATASAAAVNIGTLIALHPQ